MAATATKSAKRSATGKAKARSNAAAKAAKNGADTPERSREAVMARNAELAPQVKEMRDNGASWTEIHEQLGVPGPKGQMLYKQACLRPKDRIKEPTPELIADLRDEGTSWGDLAVRAGLSIPSVKKMYEEERGEGTAAQSRVLKGEIEDAEDKPAPKAKRAAKAAAKPKPKVGRRKAAKADPSSQA